MLALVGGRGFVPVLLALSASCAASRHGPVPLIPRAVILGDPERASASLSPDGRHWAYIAPHEGYSNVFVASVGEDRGRPLTNDRRLGLYSFDWAPDGRSILYTADDGDENWGLFAVDVETGRRRTVFSAPDVQVNVVAIEPSRPDVILVERNDRDPLAHDVYRVDLRTGRSVLVGHNSGRVRFWIPDPELRVRGMHVANVDGSFDFHVRDDEESAWRIVAHWELEDAVTSRPIGFSADGRHAYLLDSRAADRGRLVQLDLESGELVTLHEDPEYDLGDVFGVELLRHPGTHALQAITWMRERRAWHALDPDFAVHLEALRQLAEGDFVITSRTVDDRTWFIQYERPTGPLSYFSYDTESRSGRWLFDDDPRLLQYALAPMEPFSFEARDGLLVPGYAVFPPGAGRHDLPMVVRPHGGPWARDTWGLHPETQWLANRGYLVLRVNFRGSTGYGKRFVNAADHEWGRAMLHDVVDAVHWAVEQGHADPARVGILGWSFGGYQALCAAAFAPDEFTCAVSGVGPSDLVSFMSSFPPQWETRTPRFWLRGGHPVRDREMLVERSPLQHADDIRIPLLIAHGARDPRVRLDQSESIVARLEENGVEHTFLVFEDEGHGLGAPENRERFYAEVEAFLGRHLGGRVEGR